MPWLQPRNGRSEVAGFFENLGALNFDKFVPKEILETDGLVVALVDVELTVKANGKRVAEEDEIHVWRFNDAGKVARFKEGLDSYAHHIAYHS